MEKAKAKIEHEEEQYQSKSFISYYRFLGLD